ncbi:hypothetical protein [Pseudoroseicyclus aestuarii]|uniref:hypothetical protein n=1 Tax=Pseudoroseicyclus aestuarii TaxID=1795041 RepID=UPI0011B66F88|nr:hypothetical protein [Pseudoroseicyclus aestuarii]
MGRLGIKGPSWISAIAILISLGSLGVSWLSYQNSVYRESLIFSIRGDFFKSVGSGGITFDGNLVLFNPTERDLFLDHLTVVPVADPVAQVECNRDRNERISERVEARGIYSISLVCNVSGTEAAEAVVQAAPEGADLITLAARLHSELGEDFFGNKTARGWVASSAGVGVFSSPVVTSSGARVASLWVSVSTLSGAYFTQEFFFNFGASNRM